MAERRKLTVERMALLMHDMRLRYGHVVRDGAQVLDFPGTCVDCGQDIPANTLAFRAHWKNRPITGYWAHVDCPPLESDWLRDESFVQVFDYYVWGRQRCAWCYTEDASVRAAVPAPLDRFPRGGIILNYICNGCAEAKTRPR